MVRFNDHPIRVGIVIFVSIRGDLMEAFVNEVLMAYGDWRFLTLTTVLLVVGLVFLKGYKKRFVIPALILAAVILNPLFYNLWYKFNDRSYWRMMWMVPIIPVCVIVPAFFIEKCKKDIVKVGVLFLATAIMILCGNFIYDGSREVFAAANNPEKLPDDVVAVGEALLEMDEYPTVVADASISVYLRQYSGKIRSPYSRSVSYGTPSKDGAEIYKYLTQGDMAKLSQKMLNYDYEYLVTLSSDDERTKAIYDAGFELLMQVNDFGIYRVLGQGTEVRTYNDEHQVTSITTIDEEGNPTNGNTWYATIYYGYDEYGRVNHEYRTDAEGNGVIYNVFYNIRGAGYTSVMDIRGRTLIQYFLDENGDIRQNGTAKRTCEYDGNMLAGESYYDINSNPINSGKSGYATLRNEYETDGSLSLTYFYDVDGNYVECGSSYLHQYLQFLLDKTNKIVFMSVNDDAAGSLTGTIVEDMKALGLKTDLRGQYRNSYYAVITDDDVLEELSEEPIDHDGIIDALEYYISSAGNKAGKNSSIVINGVDYSKNVRGINIVVIEEGSVSESIAFDTCIPEMTVTR